MAKPIAKIEEGDIFIFLSEKIDGLRWSEKEELKDWTEEEKKQILDDAEREMGRLKKLFEKKGVQRTWKLKDMVFHIDFEKRKLKGLTPTDWERTKIIQNN